MSPAGTLNTRNLPRVPLLGPLIHPPRLGLPVLLSVPHAGRHYPDWLVADAVAGQASLEPLEDPLVDRLAWRALARGFGAVIAQAPRAAIDCNRSPDDLDPLLVEGAPPLPTGPRTRRGLGLIPSHTPRHGPLWRQRLSRDEVDARIAQAWQPYHSAVSEELATIARRFGIALLIDLHSMPARPRGEAQIVLGDRHGSSSAPWLTDAAARITRAQGFSVALNEPFAGGHLVERHGRPGTGVHAIQVEVDRTAYCQRDCRTPGAGFERVAVLFESLAVGLGEAMLDSLAIAAE